MSTVLKFTIWPIFKQGKVGTLLTSVLGYWFKFRFEKKIKLDASRTIVTIVVGGKLVGKAGIYYYVPLFQ